MTTRNDNIDLKTKVQIICLYFSKLPSNDKRRSKIISKYRELEILTGIKANTIRQWTDSFDPYFKNGRKGYHQRDLENENKSLWKVYNEYKDFSLSELQNKVSEIYKNLDKNSYFLCIGGKEVYIYSIKTKKEETSTSLYNLDATTEIIDYNVRIDNLNRYNPKTSNSQKLKVGDLLFLSLGGDSEKWKEWENGLTAIGQVENIHVENSTNNYEITAKVLIKLPTEITPSDLYYYPDTSNEKAGTVSDKMSSDGIIPQKGRFNFTYLHSLLSKENERSKSIDVLTGISHNFQLNSSQIIDGFGAQKEVVFHHNMIYDVQNSKDKVTGSKPRQIGFFGIITGSNLFIDRINIFTWSEEEMYLIAQEAINAGYKTLGDIDYKSTDGNFILEPKMKPMDYGEREVIVTFTHQANLYAGLYHIQMDIK